MHTFFEDVFTRSSFLPEALVVQVFVILYVFLQALIPFAHILQNKASNNPCNYLAMPI